MHSSTQPTASTSTSTSGGKIKNIKERDPEKERLMKNSMDFIMKMMPSYLRDIADFPRFLLQTYDLYWQSKRRPNIDPGTWKR